MPVTSDKEYDFFKEVNYIPLTFNNAKRRAYLQQIINVLGRAIY